jgi:ABC-2 type transport system ATP-binding protein
MIEVRGLSKRYGDTTAVDDLSFTVRPGIVTGFLGPNGAGKTTLLPMMATVLAPTSGRIRLLGNDPGHYGPRREIRRRLGYLPQSLGYYPGFTVVEFIEYFALLKEMPAAKVPGAWLQRGARQGQVMTTTGIRAARVHPAATGRLLRLELRRTR